MNITLLFGKLFFLKERERKKGEKERREQKSNI